MLLLFIVVYRNAEYSAQRLKVGKGLRYDRRVMLALTNLE
jgi:hypothetical protein